MRQRGEAPPSSGIMDRIRPDVNAKGPSVAGFGLTHCQPVQAWGFTRMLPV